MEQSINLKDISQACDRVKRKIDSVTCITELNHYTLGRVPICCRQSEWMDTIKKLSQILDNALMYQRVLGKTLTTEETDPFDPEILDAVAHLDSLRHATSLLTPGSCPEAASEFGETSVIDPKCIFDSDGWVTLLRATYVQCLRSESVPILTDMVTSIAMHILEGVQYILDMKTGVNENAIEFIQFTKGSWELTIERDEEQVFFSEEELEQIRRAEEIAEERRQKKLHEEQLVREVGKLRDELHKTLLDNESRSTENKELIKELFPDLLDNDNQNRALTDEDALFIRAFRKYLDNLKPKQSDGKENPLRVALDEFLTSLTVECQGGLGYTLCTEGLTVAEVNAMIKHLVNHGYSAVAMPTYTELDGSLALTTLHIKEYIAITK